MLERIHSISKEEDFKGEMQITPQGKGVEVILRIPLQFQVVNITKPATRRNSSPRRHAPKVKVVQKEHETSDFDNSEFSIRPGIAF